VQKLFADLYEKGFIYLDSYTGQYSVGEEMFVEGPPGTIGPDGKPTETVTEENFFFKLSAFGDRIAALIESNELLITPDTRRNEVLSFVRGGLKDLSISRSSFTWGIPVPEPAASKAKEKHVIYVWLDALANYMTAVGYGSDAAEDVAQFQKYWPADLHLVGKEIIRFHCVYWPAFLLAAGLPLPKAITAHGWLLFDNAKMSKSKGNIVRTETILDAFGDEVYGKQFPESTKAERDLFASDVLRYFLLREIPFGQDGSFSFDALITRYNADLANGYGNLVSRTFKMISNYFGDLVPEVAPEIIEKVITLVNLQATFAWKEEQLAPLYRDFQELRLDRYLQGIEVFISVTDETISTWAPWKPKATDQQTLENRQYCLVYSWQMIRIITALLYPILPDATAKVWAQLGLGDIETDAKSGKLNNLQWGGLKPGAKLGPLAPIFPRADKGLTQMMTDMEDAQDSKLSSSKLSAQQDPASTHPGAPPRSGSIAEPALTVGGSAATTTRDGLPPSHTEAAPSGVFASAASQTPVTAGPTDAAPQITIDDFAKIELRVAQIVVAERIPKADKLLRLEVDLGPQGKRQILSGIAEFYTPEELVGRRIVVITNLAPRKMRGLESHGMLLAASEGEHGKPALATCGDEIALGARLK
jgi:methionyl-tRNA synthetase